MKTQKTFKGYIFKISGGQQTEKKIYFKIQEYLLTINFMFVNNNFPIKLLQFKKKLITCF